VPQLPASKRGRGRPPGQKTPPRIGRDFALAFAKLVKERRLELGLSQAELALRSGYRGKEGICAIENGATPTLPYALALADALSVRLDKLIRDALRAVS